MAVSAGNARALRLARVILVNVALAIALLAATEFVLHRLYNWTNPFLDHGENALRSRDPVFTHTLRPNFDGYDVWGPVTPRIFTNSLGFKDGATRSVPAISDRKRIVFIGDSFTEGVGLPYEQTFVGRFAQAFSEIDVLNAGVSSYAPSVYYEKLKFYLDKGLKFDEAIVYIDISDIQDESISYRYDQNGALEIGVFTPNPEQCLPSAYQLLTRSPPGWLEKRSFVAEFVSNLIFVKKANAANAGASLRELMQPGRVYSRDWSRAVWTFDDQASCYGEAGVAGGVRKALRQMDRLHALLSAQGVALSVGVYPWPHQLLYDVENSRQAQIWRDWCAGKCRRFFDHFPAFFQYKDTHPDYVRDLFFWADVHFNDRGNSLLADDLVAQYRR
ncbi:SGNH/GDSL hydrolase family protein [Methylosinus sp. RM1]|uniref:SGNH/GDSL hydrolase family protein n=1 Tax=Methylosinus sp. RM1 TaxID=2583817 RepID=UPI00140E819F|nr:SGNH/GDSL hydrolase family protein [Methylosinus sp. RM1]